MPLSAKDFIGEAYRKILGRDPDIEGLKHYLGRLSQNEIDRVGVVVEMLHSQEFAIQTKERCLWHRFRTICWALPMLSAGLLSRVFFRKHERREAKVMMFLRSPPARVTFETKNEIPKSHFSDFYRGENCNFGPYLADQKKEDFVEHFVLKGLMPNRPIISKTTKVTAFGSCFALNITKHLMQLGFNLSKKRDPEIYVSKIDEGLVNVYALLGQFEWALEGITPQADLWHGPEAKSFPFDESIRDRTKQIFTSTDVFIITVGLSEIWYDEISRGVFWRAIPMHLYDPTRHKFRVCSHAETLAAPLLIRQLIRTHCDADIIFTLSPIPLIATFRAESCLTANTASKAILRSALDEFFRDEEVCNDVRCHYFQAYEMVTELFPSRYMADGKHPHQFIIEAIMKVFEAFYCETNLTKKGAEGAFKEAQRNSAVNALAAIGAQSANS